MPGRAQDGFTLVEVMIAAFVLTVGLLGSFNALDSSSHLTTTVRMQQIAANEAEQAIEQLRALSYGNLALSSAPTHAGDGNTVAGDANPVNPNYWVTSGGNFSIQSNWNDEGSASIVSGGESFVTAAGGVSPGPTSFTLDGVSGSVYRYITYENETCTLLGVNICLGTTDSKRITVAVVLTGAPGVGVRKPVWASTVVANPSAGVGG